MKPPVSTALRQTVITLRRKHSHSEVARLTGLPIGTVKTICSRSGVFRDNQAHRALFALPAVKASGQTLPVVAVLPEQRSITGDQEVDAVLWLREVIATGRADLIEKAQRAAKKIKTPLLDLEKRYRNYLVANHPGNLFAALSSFDFGDLDALASRSTKKLTLRNEALARFGSVDALFADTPAEQFAIDTLAGLTRKAGSFWLEASEVAARFKARPDLMPNSLPDCLHELAYWRELYALRDAEGGTGAGDTSEQATAREDFAFVSLAHLRPRNSTESIAVINYLAAHERMDREETNDILLNVVGPG